ncbi:endonuclease/exonuclease/phosphatase family protein [Paenochrobactrum pullorum]|uniref:endonuclease/exonuclease/phosphatase family protein n=1 Tax=Paenochrobactrum pullorum TaxID=1324351 RepID=UPI0035BC4771
MRTTKKTSSLSFAAFIVAVLATIPLVLGFFGEVHPALDTFSHIRAHLSVALLLFSLPLLLTGLKREALLLCLFCVLSFATTLEILRDQLSGIELPESKKIEGATYSLVQINLLYDHPEPQRVLQMIGQQNPDVITYQEASKYWEPWLKILEGRYPYHLLCKDYPNSWGVGILSRRPFIEGAERLCVDDGVLAAVPIDFGGQIATIASLHLSWPWPKQQPEQLKKIEPSLRAMKHPLIIAGDYNATSWSHALARMTQASDTYDVRGIGATWMLKQLPISWAKWLGVQIDHILVSANIFIEEAKTLDEVGSDHLPLYMKFTLPTTAEPSEDSDAQIVQR